MKQKQAIESLRRVSLFSACTDKELELLMGATTQLHFDAGTVLAAEGAGGHEFMVITDGKARVETAGVTLATLAPGDFFGEISLLDGGPRTATVVAETDLTAEVIGQREFGALIERAPHLAKSLLAGLAARLRAADLRLAG
jgi:CRP/FNR family transcriptional regulator, cyclic AMP receptor protein